MAENGQVRHKPGVFKQPNKTHKTGRHKSKGQLEKDVKGRVNVKVSTKKQKSELNRRERLNQSQQIRKQKRDAVLAKKRGRGVQGSPPFVVAIVPLCHGLNAQNALKQITSCDDQSTLFVNNLGASQLTVPRFKQRFTFITPEYGDLYGLLDVSKVADSIVFLVSPESGIDRYGEKCLSCLLAQGLPSYILALQGLNVVPQKKHAGIKKTLQKRLSKLFPDPKFQSIDTAQDGLLILRTVGSQKVHNVTYRDHRPHMLAEDVAFELQDQASETGTLKITGYLRGQALSANGLVHIPGWDTYQLLQIDAATDPSLNSKGDDQMMEADVQVQVLEHANPGKQTSLEIEAELDPMEGEQTWPTAEELEEAEEAQEKAKTKRVPKGMSDYQAAWIVDSDGEDNNNDDVTSDEDEDMMGADSDSDEDEDAMSEEYEDDKFDSQSVMTTEGGDTNYDATIDIDEEVKMMENIKAARTEQLFPDEVDTPMDTSARVRFQRYRGLKSFRTSPWDPKENLPHDYSRIFQFQNFKRTKKRVMDGSEDGVLPGWYITIHIANVSKQFMESYTPGKPIVVYGLLEHEQKVSVVHFLLKRHHTSSVPIKSKERMTFHVGFRRFTVCPIYSQHTNGDKHKFERYLQDICVATVYCPITFPPVPVLMFRDCGNGRHDYVAGGSVLSVNPSRVVVKRIILSGHPYKINKKSAVVRYMFFNRKDIVWFKPVELRTKWGRRGHIKEPLGTHGHMKCIFDGQPKSQDTVMMNLFKRVYPKWTYQSFVQTPEANTNMSNTASLTSISVQQEMMDEMFD